jgi:hypothetical protein
MLLLVVLVIATPLQAAVANKPALRQQDAASKTSKNVIGCARTSSKRREGSKHPGYLSKIN